MATADPILSLPELPPLSAENRSLRQEGVHTHVSSRGSGQDSDDIIGLHILIDGMPINHGGGEAFHHDVDFQSVKYAEVYREADALRYGGVTLGGAINSPLHFDQ